MVSAKLPRFGSSLPLVLTGAVLTLSLLPGTAAAQSQSDTTSVADAARRAREQKKNAPKPARTLTNDDLPAPPAGQPAAGPAGGTESAAPEQASTESEAGTPAKAPAAETTAPAETAQKKKAEIEAALKHAKAELAQAQGELDVLQRKSALDSDSFYSQTDYSRDTDGKARLDADAQQVNDKKSQVDELKSKVAALQAELGGAAEPDKPAQPQ
jgi:hypothetical protein